MKLPVADAATVRKHSWLLLKGHRRELYSVVALHSVAALAGLAGPLLLGRLVDSVIAGTTMSAINLTALLLLAAVAVQAVFTKYAQQNSTILGETVFAGLREDFLNTITGLPLSTVERAGTGELLGRTTNDVDRISFAVRFGVPRILVAVITITITLIASFFTSPLVAIAMFIGAPALVIASRWYLKRAGSAYQHQSAMNTAINGSITESVEGARTTDALNLWRHRKQKLDADIHEAYKAERRTLFLRTVLIPTMDASFVIAPVVILMWGAFLAGQGHVSVGAVTTIVVYATQMVGPIFELVFWLDETQMASASLARIIGVGLVERDRSEGQDSPANDRLVASDVHYAYRPGHNVLHGISLELRPGERLAMVGPSGAGKSTLGRMLAGIHPPTEGSVKLGGVHLVELPLEELRGQVALVTQEHHVFVGTLRDNLLLAKESAPDAEVWAALDSVGAGDWVRSLADGLDTEVGSGALSITPAQAQRIALARLILLDPHTLVLDEATSLLDPRAARSLEASMNAVLHGRTVVAIAHRLHTAHDADRVAVVDGGRIVEIGPHSELVEAGGDYAALWESWQQE